MKKKSVFIFRRDLRCDDNIAMIKSIEVSDEVLPVFIFDPVQIEKNEYFAANAFKFLLESLKDLDQQLRGRLKIFYGNPVEILSEIKEEYDFDAVSFTIDYTPFSRKRDKAIADWCTGQGVDCRMIEGLLLNSVNKTLKADGTPYMIYTPFARNAKQFLVSRPQKFVDQKISSKDFSFSVELNEIEAKVKTTYALSPPYKGGRQEALSQLENFVADRFDGYGNTRDIPRLSSTSGLAPHLKFGTISPREIYHSLPSTDSVFVNELYWRDFFTQIGWYFPHVFEGEKNFRPMYDKIQWENNEQKFEAWCEGKTGYPIVDAGMRELNTTGFMHNRVRMITASFLVKDLHVDWKWGERYFAQHLVDYDPAVNNGNWQWAASTGCDAQPYFRIFNPWRQLERFDPECEYIQRWIPELKDSNAKEIRSLEKGQEIEGYPGLIVDHKVASARTKELYLEARG